MTDKDEKPFSSLNWPLTLPIEYFLPKRFYTNRPGTFSTQGINDDLLGTYKPSN